MAFQLVEDYVKGPTSVAPPKDNFPFLMTDAEAAVAGRAYKYSSGRLTKCGATDIPHIIAVEAATAGTDVKVRGFYITPGMVFKVAATGTQAGTFVLGLTVAKTDSNGDYIDWAQTSGGAYTVLRIDTTNLYVWVTPNKCLFAL